MESSKDEINLLDYWNAIKKHRRLIASVTMCVTVVTALISLTLPKYYLAEAVIMPITNKGGGGGLGALAGQMGGLASFAGIGGAGLSTPGQQFMALLKTRTLAEAIINSNQLLPVLLGEKAKYGSLDMEVSAEKLRTQVMTFSEDKKSGTIKVGAEVKDPALAAKIANGYVEGLQRFISGNSFTVATRNRIFIEKQLAENKRDLLIAGKELNEFYKNGKVSNVEAMVDVPIENSLENNVDGIKLDDLMKKSEELGGKIKDLKTVKAIPQQVYLQYLTLRRGLLAQINSLLTQQYEMAKIEEAKDELAFQVIDPARVPEMKSKPHRSMIVLSALMGSLFASCLLALYTEHRNKSVQ